MSFEDKNARSTRETEMNNTMNPYVNPGIPHDAARDAGHAVSSAASAVGRKADDVACAVGSRMESLGETVRQRGPQEGTLGRATEGVASALEQSGRYLEGGFGQMCDDITNLIRRHPLPALMLGLGVGFLLASATKR